MCDMNECLAHNYLRICHGDRALISDAVTSSHSQKEICP